jgi:hypothetical protein
MEDTHARNNRYQKEKTEYFKKCVVFYVILHNVFKIDININFVIKQQVNEGT